MRAVALALWAGPPTPARRSRRRRAPGSRAARHPRIRLTSWRSRRFSRATARRRACREPFPRPTARIALKRSAGVRAGDSEAEDVEPAAPAELGAAPLPGATKPGPPAAAGDTVRPVVAASCVATLDAAVRTAPAAAGAVTDGA